MLANAGGNIFKPKPHRSYSHSCPKASRNAVLWRSGSAIGSWKNPDAKSIDVNHALPANLWKIV